MKLFQATPYPIVNTVIPRPVHCVPSKEYAIEFKKIKDEFERGYNSKGSEFFNTKEYKEIKRWLEDIKKVSNFGCYDAISIL